MTDKAYPDLQEDAREQLALTRYLGLLKNQQVAFSVRQKRPKTLDEAVATTLETESYLVPSSREVSQVDVGDLPDTPTPDLPVAATGSGAELELLRTMKQLVERVERLETRLERDEEERHRQKHRTSRSGTASPASVTQRQPIVCKRCGQEGHFARGCASSRRHQGN